MRMSNEDLLKLKIKVDCSDDRAYQEICLLVDKAEFLELLPKLRKDFGIAELISLDEFHNKTLGWIYDEQRGKEEKKKINLPKYKKFKNIQDLLKQPETKDTDLFDRLNYTQRYLIETTLVCLALGRPRSFNITVAETMFCGEVSEAGYEPTGSEVIENGSVMPFFDIPRIAIYVTPTTTYKDLKESFREANKKIKTDKRLSYYKPRIGVVSNIRKYRKWWWERLKGKKYSQIADEWFSNHENDTSIDEIAVIKGARKYRELLRI